jgi:hypothetical protein
MAAPPPFRDAVAAIDAGDLPALERLLAEHPALATERLREPWPELKQQVGAALDGFFKEPYLLWFVAEDPVRNGTLPANIADVARAIVDAVRRSGSPTLQEQLDYALSLVAWSWIAAGQGVQLALLDVLLDAGGSPKSVAENALVNGHAEAAAHVVDRTGWITLATAACIGRWDDLERLAAESDARERQFALVLAALNGRAEAIRRLIALGADPAARASDLYNHATPLHHAVCSADLETVRVLIEAGAPLDARDSAFEGTPLGWAWHYITEQPDGPKNEAYRAIADLLRDSAPPSR